MENLNGEIRHLSAKIPIILPEDFVDHDIMEDETINKQTPTTLVHNLECAKVKTKAYEEMECFNDKANCDQNVNEISKSPEETEDNVWSECNFALSSNEGETIHVENVHPKIDLSDLSQGSNENTKHLRELPCGRILENNKHDKLRKHACELCDYITSQTGHMKKHIKTVHPPRSHISILFPISLPLASPLAKCGRKETTFINLRDLNLIPRAHSHCTPQNCYKRSTFCWDCLLFFLRSSVIEATLN